VALSLKQTIKSTKSGSARRIQIEPELLSLPRALFIEAHGPTPRQVPRGPLSACRPRGAVRQVEAQPRGRRPGSRAGELAALDWSDVDLEPATLHIHRSMDRVRHKKKIKPTKSATARRIPIEPELLLLLRSMFIEAHGPTPRQAPRGPVFRMPSVGVLSSKLRYYLGVAGVTRADLFASDETRKAITFHDLRATGITWMAVRGDDPLKIMRRAGHAGFETTQIYLREAENLSKSFGTVFPALPAGLLRGGKGLGSVSDSATLGGKTPWV
jgi:integrase